MIEISHLTKRYGSFTALNDVTLQLYGGKIVGILGPNGSGKTTLIKTLAGLLKPSGGSVKIDGKSVGIETKSLVSYLPERTYFSSWMKVEDCLALFEEFYADFDRKRAEEMLSALQIPLNAPMRTLSKGTKEKVQLLVVMSRRAKVYLLDEPIAGVDPAARDYILDTILKNYDPEAVVLITTHLIYDVENVIDRYVFLSNGEIVECGDTKELKEERGLSLDEYFRQKFRYVPYSERE